MDDAPFTIDIGNFADVCPVVEVPMKRTVLLSAPFVLSFALVTVDASASEPEFYDLTEELAESPASILIEMDGFTLTGTVARPSGDYYVSRAAAHFEGFGELSQSFMRETAEDAQGVE